MILKCHQGHRAWQMGTSSTIHGSVCSSQTHQPMCIMGTSTSATKGKQKCGNSPGWHQTPPSSRGSPTSQFAFQASLSLTTITTTSSTQMILKSHWPQEKAESCQSSCNLCSLVSFGLIDNQEAGKSALWLLSAEKAVRELLVLGGSSARARAAVGHVAGTRSDVLPADWCVCLTGTVTSRLDRSCAALSDNLFLGVIFHLCHGLCGLAVTDHWTKDKLLLPQDFAMMSCPEDKEDCRAPVAKQRRLVEADKKGKRDGGDVPGSQEAEAAQALWEMTTWRETAEPHPKAAESEDQPVNVALHTPERGSMNDNLVHLPRCTPERGDTGESAMGPPHVPEGGETGENLTKLSKPTLTNRVGDANEESLDQRKRMTQQSPEMADTDDEPSVLSPLSSDSDLGDLLSCSEGDECCIVSVGTQPKSNERSLQALESVQQELRVVNDRAERALLQLKRRYGQLRKPHIQKRNSIIRTIPGFWVTAFLNHPQLSAMIDDRDEDTLSYMNNLQVEDFTHLKSSCKIKFYFNPNPYFKNEVIIKEFQYGGSGRLISHSTPIRWWKGQNTKKSSSSAPSFFSWFSDHSFPTADRIAAIIKEDLWPNPLQYYLIGEGESDDQAAEDSDTDNADDCVVIVDDEDEEEGEEDEDEDDEVHEILENSEKQTEGSDEDDDDNEDEEGEDLEVIEEESVTEELLESTTKEHPAGKLVLDVDDSGQSSGREDNGEEEEDEDG
ncbi:testis-specific Y-encoded-like protein 2 [Bombina bombina]|uniref:testis-specific Y-encoded-like protein 2 n=1 Tax=Bombina bombina TaxID=8345 RepID=UPI00235A863C|nr:testis-specific Y-encoded-like protein 2 [Bombina bombina]